MDIFAAEAQNPQDDEATRNSPTIGDTRPPHEAVVGNEFQKAIAAWRSINLSSLISTLDSQASQIVAHQKDALVERKDVAQKTKEFRKLDDSEKLTEYKALLKSYQSFIDLLTTHGKTSSSAFLQVYSTLADAPDPFPLLEASVESVLASEDAIPKLTQENEQLNKTVTKLTAQLEETERRLENESRARRQVEDDLDRRVKEVESAWTKVLDEKQENWNTKEKALEEKVESQDRLMREIKASYEVAQRLGAADESTQAQQKANTAELDMMSSELERTSARLAAIEARNEELRMELARALSQSHAESRMVEDDPSYIRVQSENSSLLRKVDAYRAEKDSNARKFEAKLRQIDTERAQLSTENHELRTKMQKQADYDEILRELNMLRSIELSADDEEDAKGPTEMNGSAGKESLEKLLLSRNKSLSNDLTLLRVSHQELQQQFESLQEELSRTNADLEKSQNLCSTLENDLLKIQDEAANALPSSGMSVAGTYVSRYPPSRRGRSSPTSSIISGYDSRTPTSTLESLRAGEPVGGGSGMLPMIQAQRDRFKQKNVQLEEELSKTYATVTSLRQEIASLQKDNLGLYEKSRYISAYSRGQPGTTTSSSAYSGTPSHTSIQVEPNRTTDRYRSQYEAKISPFAAFRGKESARAYRNMSLPERVIFSFTRMVLATRWSRNLFAGYCLALHLLIFLLLYWMGSTSMEKHGAPLGSALAALEQANTGQQEIDHTWPPQGLD